ncbi:hypothetical protein HPB52_007917 [Rhipicephalus sanguineus]|uniref:Tick transposon n=1 Tax=Rhipicephalus sanguineus TaxID=34632 RepID=A0A9D4QIT5_RHISA|nr:hypothetical protein HPB52_007917 [Rhipicephalus sanguineus]
MIHLLALLRAAAVRADPDWGYPKAGGPGTRLWKLAHDLRHTAHWPHATYASATACAATPPQISAIAIMSAMHAGPTHIYRWSETIMSSPCKSARARASRVHTLSVTRTGTRFLRVVNTPPLPTSKTFRSRLTCCWRPRRHPALNSRLAHLQAVHTSLTNRWNKQRHNSRLRRRIAALGREIERTPPLLPASSGNSCAQDFPISWAASNRGICYAIFSTQLQRVIQAYPGDTSSLMADLAAKYLHLLPSHGLSLPLAFYSGSPNTELDADITEAEHTLQRATDVVMDHVHAAGLTCSAAKSALILIRPPDRRRSRHPIPPSWFKPSPPPFPLSRISACCGWSCNPTVATLTPSASSRFRFSRLRAC